MLSVTNELISARAKSNHSSPRYISLKCFFLAGDLTVCLKNVKTRCLHAISNKYDTRECPKQKKKHLDNTPKSSCHHVQDQNEVSSCCFLYYIKIY